MFCDCTKIGYSSRTCILTTQRGLLTLKNAEYVYLCEELYGKPPPIMLYVMSCENVTWVNVVLGYWFLVAR